MSIVLCPIELHIPKIVSSIISTQRSWDSEHNLGKGYLLNDQFASSFNKKLIITYAGFFRVLEESLDPH